MVGSVVLTQYQRVMDIWTDRQTNTVATSVTPCV